MTHKVTPVADRFATKYEKAESGCWLWTGARKPGGYGNFQMRPRQFESAHRASWLLHRGEIPDGLWVLHRCDDPRCVNPDHLFLGTPLDNTRDMEAKGRDTKNQKLDDAQVLEIRAARSAGESLKTLAARYGVAQSCISRIANGTRRVTVSEPLPPHLRPNRRQKRAETVDADTGEILEAISCEAT